MNMDRLRRNDIVLHEAATAWTVPARVTRRIDTDRVEVINTLGRVVIVEDERLIRTRSSAVDTQRSRFGGGRPVVAHMPSLRRLKQHAAWYNPQVWRRPKRA